MRSSESVSMSAAVCLYMYVYWNECQPNVASAQPNPTRLGGPPAQHDILLTARREEQTDRQPAPFAVCSVFRLQLFRAALRSVPALLRLFHVSRFDEGSSTFGGRRPSRSQLQWHFPRDVVSNGCARLALLQR